jgi:MerR family transcriptional regulator/heat shock protein HspR
VTGLGKLDDEDYPAYTTGQAARALGVQVAFLRSLDAAGVVSPQRSEGGHRRYTRRQLALVVRLRQQLDEGHSVASATRIVSLQDQLADAAIEIDHLRQQFDQQDKGHRDRDVR